MTRGKILLAEDEAALRFLLTETLEEEGYEIKEAEDGQQALHCLQSEAFDLVILDYMMPERTGVDVCEWLRGNPNPNSQAPVILLTAKALEKDRERAKAAGVTQYVVKPFSPLQLVDTIEEMIRRGTHGSAGL